MNTVASDCLSVTFEGPYGWLARKGVQSIFEAPSGKNAGLYLWTVAAGAAERVYYVGETSRSFSQRHLEHLKEHLSGSYHVFDPSAFAEGRKNEIWPGLYGSQPRPTIQEWISALPALTEPIVSLASIYRFFVASVQWESRLRHRAEAAIANTLAESGQDFQDAGVRYRPRQDNEQPIELHVQCTRPLLGLPSRIAV